MNETRQLLSALREINGSDARIVARLTPSLIGMFGSPAMFDVFLADLDSALVGNALPDNLRRRATNLVETFIPQVADLNGVREYFSHPTTLEDVRTLHVGSPAERKRGVEVILSALTSILVEVLKID